MSEIYTAIPKVSIGMPVYNGAESLALVLDDLLRQTFGDFEIILSDNGSRDATPEICRDYAARDPRITWTRQPVTLSPTENFRFVLDRARAPFFMWAAHDDFRSPDFIEKLLNALEQRPDAVLAFGDIVAYTNGVAKPFSLDFKSDGVPKMKRLYRAALHPLHHLYGLWRTDALRRIEWRHVDWWHDTPLMMAAVTLGAFLHVPGPIFHYKNNQHFFFDWKPASRPPDRIRRIVARTGDLASLVWQSGATVYRVGGLPMGLAAGAFATVKVLDQTRGFLQNRIIPANRSAGKQETSA
jgi:glycosyltransferase involved in cell wall biosynthesis